MALFAHCVHVAYYLYKKSSAYLVTFSFVFFTVTIVSGLLMFLLFVSELSFYLSTEVSQWIVE